MRFPSYMSSRVNNIRMLLAILCLASALLAPWWLTFILALALCLRFRAWEVIAIGVLMDILWLPGPVSFSWEFLPHATIVATALLFGLEPLRRQLLTGPGLL